MNENDWERTRGEVCPSCGQETLRFTGRVCPQCSQKLPVELSDKLNEMGFHVEVDDNEVYAVVLGHEIRLGFSPGQGVLYYQPARQAERRLFRGLEADVRRWAHEKSLGFATKEGIEDT